MKKSIAELKQDSRMLDSLMDMLSKAAYKDDKPVLDALTAAWRQGHRAGSAQAGVPPLLRECKSRDHLRCHGPHDPGDLSGAAGAGGGRR